MKRPGWIILGLLALAGTGFGIHGLAVTTKAAPKRHRAPVPILAATATIRPMPDRISAIGTVEAYNTVAIKPQVDGEITRVFFTQGQTVKPGQTLFEIDPRPYRAALDQAEAAASKDRATLSGAKADLARYGTLVNKHYTSAKTYQDQRTTVDELKATVKLDDAAIESARLNLSHTLIRAPIGGRTGAILVNRGNVVRASLNPTLVTIAETRPIYVRFAVPEEDLAAIRRHQASKGLTVAALDAETGHTLATGRLTFIDNSVNASTGTVTLMATFANHDEVLWPGEYVTARLTLAVQQDALTVPESAIVEGTHGDYVYVIAPGDRVARRAVTVTRRQDGIAIIGKGLAAGARVVSHGQFRLSDGAHVEIRKSEAGTTSRPAS